MPARVVVENNEAMAFLDAFPLAEGHTLVIPKSHYSRFQDMEKQDAMAVFELAWKIAGAVETGSNAKGSIIAIHNGADAGQEIPHVHIHLVPRKTSDGAGPIHSMFKNKVKLTSGEMDLLQEKITANL